MPTATLHGYFWLDQQEPPPPPFSGGFGKRVPDFQQDGRMMWFYCSPEISRDLPEGWLAFLYRQEL
jgi:hypothetical protein